MWKIIKKTRKINIWIKKFGYLKTYESKINRIKRKIKELKCGDRFLIRIRETINKISLFHL